MRFAGIFVASVLIVACGARTELRTARLRPPNCGNGVIDPGEECDLGAANSDTLSFTVSQGATTFDVQAIAGNQSAVSFYAYKGASSHSGLEVEDESRLYLYLDGSGALSLVVNHNIFGESAGHATMDVSGLPAGFSIDRSDDANELRATGPTTADGNWSWNKNTDGGVIGGLCGGGWTIVVTPNFESGITSWVWVNADDSRTPLDMTTPVTIAQVPECHTDCTIGGTCLSP